MKLFNKKEEKSKVGRPRLADFETKKKAFITLGISLVLVVILLSGGLVSLNIMPNFNRLKGTVNTSLCSEIPARFQPYDEVNNPEGLYEYGFTDPKFYSAVLSAGNTTKYVSEIYPYNDSSYCNTISEEDLKKNC